jgi:cell division septal protein FtsQ
VARQHGRRRRRRILAALAVACLLSGGLALVHSSVFGARHVRVTGASSLTSSSVLAAAGLQGDPPLIDLDPAAIAARVEHLPWVLTAAVRVAWPTTVAIHVTERIPVAAVMLAGQRSSYAICDVTGRVLEIVPTRPESLPVLVLAGAGAGSPGAPGSSLPARDRPELEVASAMPESIVHSVTVVTATSLGAVVKLKDHLTAIIGDATGLSQKFVSLATVLAHHHLTGISAVDLRVPAAPVLIPKKSRPIVAGNVTG